MLLMQKITASRFFSKQYICEAMGVIRKWRRAVHVSLQHSVDSVGNVYLADTNNYRIQKFSPVKNSMSDIEVYKDEIWYLDNNGDGVFYTNDSVYSFGLAGWSSVVVQWS